MPEQLQTESRALAVRQAVNLTGGQSNRLVAFMALDDIAWAKRPRWQWTHPQLATLVNADHVFIGLLQAYLSYRNVRVARDRQARLHDEGMQIVLLDRKGKATPHDLIGLPQGVSSETRLTFLYKEAALRKAWVHPDITDKAEKTLARACNETSWSDITDVFTRQRGVHHVAREAA